MNEDKEKFYKTLELKHQKLRDEADKNRKLMEEREEKAQNLRDFSQFVDELRIKNAGLPDQLIQFSRILSKQPQEKERIDPFTMKKPLLSWRFKSQSATI